MKTIRAVLTAFLATLCVSSAFTVPRTALTSTVSLSAASDTTVEPSTMAEVKEGDKIPSVELNELQTGQDKPISVDISELIAGKKVAIFGVPGAFTPGCSKSHLPSFMDAQDELKAKGVEMTICIATNDAYVMEVSLLNKQDLVLLSFRQRTCNLTNALTSFSPHCQAWGRTSGGAVKAIRFLADGAGELTRALGLVMETPNGIRTKRFSLIAEDGVVTHYFSSAKESSDTWAPAVLAKL